MFAASSAIDNIKKQKKVTHITIRKIDDIQAMSDSMNVFTVDKSETD